jgi:hypothetical protein
VAEGTLMLVRWNAVSGGEINGTAGATGGGQ